MSLNAIKWAWQQDSQNLTLVEKFVLIALADEADQYGGNCYPSIEYLAQKIKSSKRTVSRAIVSLEAQKLIHVRRSGVYGRGNGNRYHLPLSVDNYQTKGDTQSPLTEIKGAQRVTESPIKGDTVAHNPGNTHIPAENFQKDIPRPHDGLARMPAPKQDCSACEGTGWQEQNDGSVIPCAACKQVG